MQNNPKFGKCSIQKRVDIDLSEVREKLWNESCREKIIKESIKLPHAAMESVLHAASLIFGDLRENEGLKMMKMVLERVNAVILWERRSCFDLLKK